MEEFAALIDTNEYSGNFEREMVAYITAQIGECGVGQPIAELAEAELTEKQFEWFEENILHKLDDNGCSRPARIAPTPGWSNNGNGVHYHNEDHPYPAYQSVEILFYNKVPARIRKIIEKRAYKFATDPQSKNVRISSLGPIQITAVRFVKRVTTIEEIEV